MKNLKLKASIVSLLTLILVTFTHCGDPFRSPSALVFEGNLYGGPDAVSYEAFSQTVYPLTRAHCASCHATHTQPVHASSSVKTAHDAVISQFKVNFGNISASRMVAKLRDENHNCWGDCQTAAAEMQAAIETWHAEILASGPVPETPGNQPKVTAQSLPVAVEIDKAGNPTATLEFEIDTLAGVPGAKFRIDISNFDDYTYQVTRPRIETATSNIYVKAVKILVNGNYTPQHATYNLVDMVITPVDGTLSTASMLVLKDKGPIEDLISFSFDQLEATNSPGTGSDGGGGAGDSLTAFRNSVYPVSQMYCISCHQTRFPNHASDNTLVAHDDLINGNYIDFNNPANSSLVRKVSVERHNCGNATACNNLADLYIQAIEEWRVGR